MRKAKHQAPSESHDGKPRHGIAAFWSGTISFGLVTIPVELVPAQRRARPTLREVDVDGTPLRRRFFCRKDDRLVNDDEIVRAYEFDDGRYVVVSDDELEDAEPKKSREIDLTRFVDRREISPLLFEKPYFLKPSGDSNKAYRLLAQVLSHTERAGIATFVMHEREYVVAIVGDAGVLRAHTLRFLDEIRPIGEIGLPEPSGVDSRLRARFQRAIAALSHKQFDLGELKDRYAERLTKLIERKRARGDDVVRPEHDASASPEPDAVETGDGEDLLETIRRSLKGGGTSNGRTRGRSDTPASATGRSGRPRSIPGSKQRKSTKPAKRKPAKPASKRRSPSQGKKVRR
jgi:DNA end-binding protein Ku